MKVPLTWLAEFVEINGTPEEIAAKLTSAGMKVEKTYRTGEGVEGIIVGEVSEINAHPNADKLSVVKVRTGCMDISVVCGAGNFKVGDRVPVAQPGSKVPKVGEIGRRKFRGVPSEGMLCSASELGLGDDHSGILVLDPETVVGTDLKQALGLGEAVLELEINPNRPDAMGLIGIAREVAACTGAELRNFSSILQFDVSARQASEIVQVEIRDPAGCPRYMARVIESAGSGPSPAWAQQRLILSGVRPISAIVDATNYAMLVTGQPQHAFDMDKVGGGRIVVRRAAPGEVLTSIDGVERKLDPEDLVIADESVPIALAGVMGGQDSEVTDSTVRVILETATFETRSIFRTSRRHALRSEASARFERGVDPGGVDLASRLATALIVNWAGGTAAAGVVDVYPRPVEREVITMRPDRARALLGAEFRTEQMTDALTRLGLNPENENGGIRTTVPTFRVDLKVEEDLIEEVARVIGYDKIPTTLPAGRNRAGKLSDQEKALRKLRRALIGAGLYEARTSSLVSPADLEKIGLAPDAATPLANPISRDESLLRPSLLPGLLRSAALNFSRRPGAVRLFEIGRSFHPNGIEPPIERLRLAIAMGGVTPQEWHSPERQLDFFDLKGALEVVLQTLSVRDATFEERHEAPFHPTRAAGLFAADGTRLGLFGELDAQAADRAGVPERFGMGEFDLDALLNQTGAPPPRPETSRYPAVLLDLAVVVPEKVDARSLLNTAREAGGQLLENVRLIDVYRGEQVGAGNKSIAVSMTFRSPERTLADGEALASRNAIAGAISERHSGRVRA
ncbi:phenylalanine--tRNA ligase subunit beta [soil metagenome]